MGRNPAIVIIILIIIIINIKININQKRYNKKKKKRSPLKGPKKTRARARRDTLQRIRHLGSLRRKRPLALPWRGFQDVSHGCTSNISK